MCASDSPTRNWLTRIPSDASKPVIVLRPYVGPTCKTEKLIILLTLHIATENILLTLHQIQPHPVLDQSLLMSCGYSFPGKTFE